jgi:hypothetical protein
MVRARLDVPRFVQLNSAKGRWAFLDDLTTTPLEAHTPSAVPAAAIVQAGGEPAAEARPALQKDAVVRIVREVAAGIVSEEHLEGERTAMVCACSVTHLSSQT